MPTGGGRRSAPIGRGHTRGGLLGHTETTETHNSHQLHFKCGRAAGMVASVAPWPYRTPGMNRNRDHAARELLAFYQEAGVDALVGETPVDRFADDPPKTTATRCRSLRRSEATRL